MTAAIVVIEKREEVVETVHIVLAETNVTIITVIPATTVHPEGAEGPDLHLHRPIEAVDPVLLVVLLCMICPRQTCSMIFTLRCAKVCPLILRG